MTDSSSKKNEEMANMAAELLTTKMEAARKDTQMTHILKVGTFHMEFVPDKNINVEKAFKETLSMLMDKYGDKLLNITISQLNEKGQVHYG
jgi:hypothetical protein|tara:strand:+ start:249 stop:521 length:273 start_codon:yes stop_codon:yes gene_type:complete